MPDRLIASHQTLRLKRFALASLTYLVGVMFMGLCQAVGLFPLESLLVWGAIALVINAGFLAGFRSGWNLRARDPSLTQPQIYVAACMVLLALVQGEKTHFLALPFYSSLFIFGMLRLGRRDLIRFEVFVLLTYGLGLVLRQWRFGEHLDGRIELIYGAIVVINSLWFAAASHYISRLRARLRKSAQDLADLATRDALTGVWNRRHIDHLLNQALAHSDRGAGPVCVALVDIDHFKSINDQFGHQAGDATLREVAQTLNQRLRFVDALGRYGGEEFLVVLQETALTDARNVAEDLRAGVAALRVLPEPERRLSISVGVAERRVAETLDALLYRVDGAMYRAKLQGRNRVVVDDAAVTPAR